MRMIAKRILSLLLSLVLAAALLPSGALTASAVNVGDEAALVKKVKDIANVMASAGVGFTDYITQLTYILFVSPYKA